MSSPELRNTAQVVELPEREEFSLVHRLEKAGIKVPDQAEARRMMEAARLGLPLTATQRRIDMAWFRRLTHPRWKQFTLEQFTDPNVRYYYGGMPHHVSVQISRIRAAIPGEQLYVNAKVEDPWLVTKDGTILLGWVNDLIVT